jgi:hypothetical protein
MLAASAAKGMDRTEVVNHAWRVLVVVPRKSRHWSESWTSSEELIVLALRLLQENQLLSIEPCDLPLPLTFASHIPGKGEV